MYRLAMRLSACAFAVVPCFCALQAIQGCQKQKPFDADVHFGPNASQGGQSVTYANPLVVLVDGPIQDLNPAQLPEPPAAPDARAGGAGRPVGGAGGDRGIPVWTAPAPTPSTPPTSGARPPGACHTGGCRKEVSHV